MYCFINLYIRRTPNHNNIKENLRNSENAGMKVKLLKRGFSETIG